VLAFVKESLEERVGNTFHARQATIVVVSKSSLYIGTWPFREDGSVVSIFVAHGASVGVLLIGTDNALPTDHKNRGRAMRDRKSFEIDSWIFGTILH
jgi:hypothetical protein